jgi:hypothetical protein
MNAGWPSAGFVTICGPESSAHGAGVLSSSGGESGGLTARIRGETGGPYRNENYKSITYRKKVNE